MKAVHKSKFCGNFKLGISKFSSEFQDIKENFDLWAAFFFINLFKWQKAFTVKADEESFQQHT